MELGEFCQHILDNAHRIFVREQVNGKWGAYPLSELSHDCLVKHTTRWWNEGRMPHMVGGTNHLATVAEN